MAELRICRLAFQRRCSNVWRLRQNFTSDEVFAEKLLQGGVMLMAAALWAGRIMAQEFRGNCLACSVTTLNVCATVLQIRSALPIC